MVLKLPSNVTPGTTTTVFIFPCIGLKDQIENKYQNQDNGYFKGEE